jgi:CheY-like chemotaxis protein
MTEWNQARDGTDAPRILVVDDQEEMRELLLEILLGEGFEASAVSSGDLALRELERSSYDLVLTDLNMPGMDGLALLREIRQRAPDFPVIVITGYGSRTTERRVLAEGARGYISKPCTVQRVSTSVRSALSITTQS